MTDTTKAPEAVREFAEMLRLFGPCTFQGRTITHADLVALSQPASQVSEMRETWSSMAEWTAVTFGPVTLERIATRAHEEMQELLADPSDVTEAADVCIVLSRYPGIEEAINRKMAINRARKWRLNGDGSGYHIKEPAILNTSREGGE